MLSPFIYYIHLIVQTLDTSQISCIFRFVVKFDTYTVVSSIKWDLSEVKKVIINTYNDFLNSFLNSIV